MAGDKLLADEKAASIILNTARGIGPNGYRGSPRGKPTWGAGMPRRHTSFAAFLTADLEAEMAAAAKDAQSIQEQMLAAERERAELGQLQDELPRYVLENQLALEELARIARALDTGSLPECAP